MSKVKMNSVWQHQLVLPYLLGDLKRQVETITPVEKILLFGSRARVPVEQWHTIEGKDWDVFFICAFPILNMAVWTQQQNYHVDLKVISPAILEKIVDYKMQLVELFPNQELNL